MDQSNTDNKTLPIPGKDGDDVLPYLEKHNKANDCTGGLINRANMVVQWSEEDQLFLVTIPEFIDFVVMPCTHSKSREEAIHHGEEVIEMYLEAWQAEGEPIPEPKTLQVA